MDAAPDTYRTVEALFSAFNNAIEWFRKLRVDKAVGPNFITLQVQLDIIGLRLSRWGEAVGLTDIHPTWPLPWSEDQIRVAHCHLRNITEEFEKLDGTAVDQELVNGRIQTIDWTYQILLHDRENKTFQHNGNSIGYTVVRDGPSLDQFLRDMDGRVEALFGCFPDTDIAEIYRISCEDDAAEFIEPLTFLLEAARKHDDMLADALARKIREREELS